MKNLVLIPGLGSDGAVWSRTVVALGDVAVCSIADTLRDDILEGMARRILAAAPETFYLAGVSMGGMVALEIMRLEPRRVCGLALLDTNARADTQEQAARRRATNAAILAGGLGAIGTSSIDYLVHANAPDEVRHDLIEMGMRVGAEIYVRQNTAVMMRDDQRSILTTIDVICMVIVGADDRLTPPSLSEEIHLALPNAQLHVIPDCGHLPPLEKPEDVAALLYNLMETSLSTSVGS